VTATMRAAVIEAPRRSRVEDVARPDPAGREVRVRLEGCGVCASNLGPWQGQPWTRYPLAPGAPGHEGWGRVDAVGADVRSVREGDRVAFLSSHAYAEYDTADAAQVVVLPRELDGQPFPGEALGCALNVLRRSRVQAGDTVAVIGIGFLGALLTRLAARQGARVIAISRRPFALELARAYGAAEAIAIDGVPSPGERVRELTGGRGCERVIEAVGRQSTLDLASELVAERGVLVIAGYHQDGPRQVNLQQWNWKGIDVVNAHERDPAAYVRGIHAALAAVRDGSVDPLPLYTHRYGLDGLGRALDDAESRPVGFVKGILVP
jgi:threonine dehydrogenase-like Zn-dependent dehydrogenase